ncbi:hypothetical protein KA977_11585 [Candidatus Dependentiae bacterium]|nr:hypothetical protein [Candidatus Dependentiae bacterium]
MFFKLILYKNLFFKIGIIILIIFLHGQSIHSKKLESLKKTNKFSVKRLSASDMTEIYNNNFTDTGLSETVRIIDSRSFLEYENKHLPFSICIPEKLTSELLPEKIKKKDLKLIFYCSRKLCSDAENSAQKAIDSGYKNVWVYYEGIEEWEKNKFKIETGEIFGLNIDSEIKSIKPGDLNKILDKTMLIDLIGDKYVGFIPNSVIMPVDEFYFKYFKIPQNKNIVVYYLNNKLAILAIKFLFVKGYDISKIKYLEGGIFNWKNCGYEIKNNQ